MIEAFYGQPHGPSMMKERSLSTYAQRSLPLIENIWQHNLTYLIYAKLR
ncbi:MAG TPA: hypothetical protein V6D20_19230 [Candidatus Obscuribacterales bacterium]